MTIYNQKTTMDWRKQLRINERKTETVIGMFILIYGLIGLFIDYYINPVLHSLPFKDAIVALLSFKIHPTATLIMLAVAGISIIITFALHDRIILFGTDYHAVTSQNARTLEEQQLYNVIAEMQVAAGLRYMPKVYIIEADYMNAFASGYNEKSALIAITRGLLQKLNRSELQAVIAHELSHIRHQDIKLTLVASVLSNLMLIAIDILFYNAIFGGGRRRGRNEEEGNANRLLLIIILLRYLLPIITLLLMLYLSRTREYMADAGAVELTRDNSPLAHALLKISGDHRQNSDYYQNEYQRTPHEGVRRAAYIFDPGQAGISTQRSIFSLFSTHPAIKDRLKALGFESVKK